MSGPADYLRLGDWNIRCDRCGKKMKGSEARQTWQGFWVCYADWEPRQPQDFVRSIVEHPTPPYVRNPGDIFLGFGDGVVMEDDGETLPDLVPGQEIDYILLEAGTWIILEN